MSTTTRKKARKTAFVPRSLFASAVGVGVIPFCVSACGGLERSPQSSGSSFGGVSSGTVASGAFTVASGAFGVSGSSFGGASSGTVASGAFTVASGAFSVGVSAFGDSGATVATMAFDAGVEFTVAAIGFDVAEAGFASPPEPNVEAGGARDVTVDAPELTVAFMGFDASAPEHDAGDKG
jgi:hypothetical protein